MKINQELVDKLMLLPKKIINEKKLVSRLEIEVISPWVDRLILHSEANLDWMFLLSFRQSERRKFQFSFHFLERGANIPIYRIDYLGNHQNPETILESVPLRFHPYAGKVFKDEHHIHYFIEGYPALAWALPLINDPFPIKEITTFEDLRNSVISFGKLINLQTHLVLKQTIATGL